MRKFIRHQFTFLLFGVGFWFPILVLVTIVLFLFNNVEDISKRVFLTLLPLNFYFTGLGILIGILILYLSGLILKLTRMRVIFSKIPIIGLFFGAGEVITIERLLHLTPCLFLLSPTCISYGWVLSGENVRIGQDDAGFRLLSVYYPNVPSLITGQVFAVRKETVIKLGNSSKEVIDLLLYSFRNPEAIEYLPWDDESPEDFVKRAQLFGLNVSLPE